MPSLFQNYLLGDIFHNRSGSVTVSDNEIKPTGGVEINSRLSTALFPVIDYQYIFWLVLLNILAGDRVSLRTKSSS